MEFEDLYELSDGTRISKQEMIRLGYTGCEKCKNITHLKFAFITCNTCNIVYCRTCWKRNNNICYNCENNND